MQCLWPWEVKTLWITFFFFFFECTKHQKHEEREQIHMYKVIGKENEDLSLFSQKGKTFWCQSLPIITSIAQVLKYHLSTFWAQLSWQTIIFVYQRIDFNSHINPTASVCQLVMVKKYLNVLGKNFYCAKHLPCLLYSFYMYNGFLFSEFVSWLRWILSSST